MLDDVAPRDKAMRVGAVEFSICCEAPLPVFLSGESAQRACTFRLRS
jgi:hypothetical protein